MHKRYRWFCLSLVLAGFVCVVTLNAEDGNMPPSTQDSGSNSFAAVPVFETDSVIGEDQNVVGSMPGRITLELKGVNVLDVLKILAKRSGMNIVAGRGVTGDVSLYLQDVDVRHALNTIVQTLGLAYDEKDGIITVMTSKEYEAKSGKPFLDDRITKSFQFKFANIQTMNQLLQQMKSQVGKIAIDERTGTFIVTDIASVVTEIEKAVEVFDQPLVTKVFMLRYAKAADLEEQLRDYLTPQIGIIRTDKRSNQVSVTDRAESVLHIEKVIDAFDVKPQQVSIDAKVIEVQLYDAFRFGIDWNYVDLKAGQVRNISLQPAQTVSAPGSSLGSGTLSAFTVGTSAGNDTLQTVINVLQNVGKTNILSSPRLLCLNNEEAKLAVATRQPYVTQTVNITTSSSNTADDVKFVDVGVTMSIVPTIAEDGNVVLKVKPEVSSSSGTFTIQGVAQGSNTLFDRTKVPIVTSQMIETTVVVKNGATVVIGGLIQDRSSKVRKKLPLLGDIPVLGAAFRTETNDFNKTELVVFLTPYIITGETKSLEAGKYLNKDGDYWVDFDKVGGYDFSKAESASTQGPFRMDDKPYYESLVKDKPTYVVNKNSGAAALPYRGKWNQVMDKTNDGDEVLPDRERAREFYAGIVHAAIAEALTKKNVIKKGPVEFEVFLKVHKSGKLAHKQVVHDNGLRASEIRSILNVIQSLAPFPPFAREMDTEEEPFYLRFAVA